MKKLLVLTAVAMFAGRSQTLAQEPAVTATPPPTAVPLEAPDKNKLDASDSKQIDATKPSKAQKWRSEVLKWKKVRRVEEGAEAGSINEVSRSVLVLGTVNGDVSTVSGDVAVLGDVTGDVTSVSGTVTVLGTVNGDATVVGGNLRVAGKVGGDASVLAGTLETVPGGQVLGESSSVGRRDLNFGFRRGGKWNGKFDRDAGGFIKGFWFSPFMLIWRSGLLILWVALSCAIAALFQPAILRAQTELRNAPARAAAFGFLWKILFWILLVGTLILSLMFIGLPLLFVLITFDLALSAFGMTLIFSIVGEWVVRRLNHSNASLYATVFAGACLLGLLRLIPVVGSLIWFAAGLFGIGATLAARFGIPTPPPQIPPTLPSVAAV